MRTFDQYFSENEILKQICKMRIKMAKSKSKKHLLHLLTTNEKYNYHISSILPPSNEFEIYQVELSKFLSSILPPRKKWVKLGEKSRRKPNLMNEFLTSNDKNFYSLLKTIKVHKSKNSKEQWFINLQVFISEIQKLSNSISYKVDSPIIFPKLKENLKKESKNECRPICMFSIRDRIILSATNKFLTKLLDDYFQDSSYAFRSKKNTENKILSHHDCIKDILNYRNENKQKILYVIECDMKKFYDTVNHDIVKSHFYELILKVKEVNQGLNLESAIRIFESYLNCFAFNVNMPKSDDLEYWSSYKIPNGEFTWINDILHIHYSDISNERIGVPQGGALSGLIANIYLNQADVKMLETKVLYRRFCDDMIIISDNLNQCNSAKKIYLEALNDLKLFSHQFKKEKELISNVDSKISSHTKKPRFKCELFSFLAQIRNLFQRKYILKTNELKINLKPFWEGKSKGPYKWSSIENNGFPWIGFVGYEINYLGEIRVRKKSLEKEIKKQKLIINEIKNAIKFEMRKSKGTACESAINRLIGMSVGRIGLDNFDEVSTDLCWKNGFKELTINKHSIRQIKQLDRNRNKQYYKLLRDVKDTELSKENLGKRQLIKYNKPFSYYYQILERQKRIEK